MDEAWRTIRQSFESPTGMFETGLRNRHSMRKAELCAIQLRQFSASDLIIWGMHFNDELEIYTSLPMSKKIALLETAVNYGRERPILDLFLLAASMPLAASAALVYYGLALSVPLLVSLTITRAWPQLHSYQVVMFLVFAVPFVSWALILERLGKDHPVNRIPQTIWNQIGTLRRRRLSRQRARLFVQLILINQHPKQSIELPSADAEIARLIEECRKVVGPPIE